MIRQGLLLRGKVQITHLGPSNSPPPPTRAPSTPRLQTENTFGVTPRKHSKDQCASDLSRLKESLEMGRGDGERNVRKIGFSCTFNSPALSFSEQTAKKNLEKSVLVCGFSGWCSGKESACQYRRLRLDPWVGKIPGGEKGNPLQYSCLENPMERGAWQTAVHGVTKSQT